MSAVIFKFPSNACALSDRLRAVRQSVNKRASEVRATPEQKRHALGVAFRTMREGGSAGWALSRALAELPRSAIQAFRDPTPPAAA